MFLTPKYACALYVIGLSGKRNVTTHSE